MDQYEGIRDSRSDRGDQRKGMCAREVEQGDGMDQGSESGRGDQLKFRNNSSIYLVDPERNLDF